MIRVNLIRGYSASNPMEPKQSGSGKMRKLRPSAKLLRKSLHSLRRPAASSHAQASALSLLPSCPITGNRTSSAQSIVTTSLTSCTGSAGDNYVKYAETKDSTELQNFDIAADSENVRFDVPCSGLPPVAQRMSLSERILAYLQEAEWSEPLVYFQDDYRVAWLCVLFAARAMADPWGYAFWHYYGRTWRRLVPFFVERAAKHRRMEIPAFDLTEISAAHGVRRELRTGEVLLHETKLPRLYQDCLKKKRAA